MPAAPSAFEAPGSAITPEASRELGRRRVSIFFLAFLLVAVVETAISESDILTRAMDDLALLALTAVGLVVIGLSWSKTSVAGLRRQHTIVLTPFVIGFVFELAAFPIEIGDPMDFGNEVPSFLLIIAILIKRFVRAGPEHPCSRPVSVS